MGKSFNFIRRSHYVFIWPWLLRSVNSHKVCDLRRAHYSRFRRKLEKLCAVGWEFLLRWRTAQALWPGKERKEDIRDQNSYLRRDWNWPQCFKDAAECFLVALPLWPVNSVGNILAMAIWYHRHLSDSWNEVFLLVNWVLGLSLNPAQVLEGRSGQRSIYNTNCNT